MVKPKIKGKAPTSSSSEPVKMDMEAPANVSGGEEKSKGHKKEEKNTEEKGENTPDKKGNKSGKDKKKKATAGGDHAVPVKDSNKPETSTREKDLKKADSMGMIFMCSSKTKKDCYHYKVLGLPASKKEIVAKIYKGMRLFLFDVDLKLMYGIYKAAGPGGYNIEPKAFNSAFPSQVRFTVLEDCLPLGEEKFKAVIRDNYYGKNKFDCQLKSEQVKNLCKLFRVTTTKGSRSKHVHRANRREARTFIDRDRERWRGLDGPRHRSFGGDRLFPEGTGMYEREAFSSPVLRPLLPAPLPPRSYIYQRPLNLDYYRGDAQLERHDRELLDLRPLQEEFSPFREPLYPVGPPPVYHHPPPPPLYRY